LTTDAIEIDARAEAERINATLEQIDATRVEVLSQWEQGRELAEFTGLKAHFDTGAAVLASVASGWGAGAAIGAAIGGVAGPIGSVLGGFLGLLVAAFTIDAKGVATIGAANCTLRDGQRLTVPGVAGGNVCECFDPQRANFELIGGKVELRFSPWSAVSWAEASDAQKTAFFEAWKVGRSKRIEGGSGGAITLWLWGEPKDRERADYPHGASAEQLRAWAFSRVLPEQYNSSDTRAFLVASCLPRYAQTPELRASAEALFDGRFAAENWYWADQRVLDRTVREWPRWLPVGTTRAHRLLLQSADLGVAPSQFARIAALDPRVGVTWPDARIETLPEAAKRAYYANALVIALAAAGAIPELSELAIAAIDAPLWISDLEVETAWRRLADPNVKYVSKPLLTTTTKTALLVIATAATGLAILRWRRKRWRKR
jgi:hypothetical protein